MGPFKMASTLCQKWLTIFCQKSQNFALFGPYTILFKFHHFVVQILIKSGMKRWLNRFIRIGKITKNPNVLRIWSNKFHLLCTFQRRLRRWQRRYWICSSVVLFVLHAKFIKLVNKEVKQNFSQTWQTYIEVD